MAGFSQSVLLQALGWATLNSFWQAGLLWCGFVLLRRFASLAPAHQYGLSVAALGISLASFIGSLCFFLSGGIRADEVAPAAYLASQQWFQATLTAASLSYLFLLMIPAGRLFQNWRYVQRLRQSQFTKAPVAYRLYVQKIGMHLGIRRQVQVHLSALVHSPVTIGFFKPLILLPVAGFNNLSIQQAEAILLHELSHIRRYDYLVNIGISIVQTLLYFNPFVRLFVKAAENSREECCDGMVLQFGYDRLAYAGALLQLEKSAGAMAHLALAATGKNQLLCRIESIMGMPRKIPTLRVQHFTGLVASAMAVLVLHSLFVVAKKEGASDPMEALSRLSSPFSLVLNDGDVNQPSQQTPLRNITKATHSGHPGHQLDIVPKVVKSAPEWEPEPPIPEPPLQVIQVSQVEAPMEALEQAEQAKVEAVIATTKKVLAKLQWKEVEKNMADALTEAEKIEAHKDYEAQVNQINWEGIERNLASRYRETNWETVDQFMGAAAHQLQLDSLETVYGRAISELQQAQQTPGRIALPDHSAEELSILEKELRKTRDSIKSLRTRPVVRF